MDDNDNNYVALGLSARFYHFQAVNVKKLLCYIFGINEIRQKNMPHNASHTGIV